MKKKLAIITLCTGFFSCSSLMYNYTQDEFTTEYIRTVRYFDKTVDGPIKKSDLRKLGKKFTFLKSSFTKIMKITKG